MKARTIWAAEILNTAHHSEHTVPINNIAAATILWVDGYLEQGQRSWSIDGNPGRKPVRSYKTKKNKKKNTAVQLTFTFQKDSHL